MGRSQNHFAGWSRVSLTLAGCSLAAILTAACAPLPVAEPAITRSAAGARPVVTPTVAAADSVPMESGLRDVRDEINAYAKTWSDEATTMSKGEFAFGEGTFWSTVVAGASAVLKNLSVATAAAEVAGGISLVDSHYNIKVQEQNYTTAADTMNCFGRAIDAIPDGSWEALYDPNDGRMLLRRDAYSALVDALYPPATHATENAKAVAGYDTLAGLWPAINARLVSAHDTLVSNQRSVTLTTPSQSDIEKALTPPKSGNQATVSLMKAPIASVLSAMRSRDEGAMRSFGAIQETLGAVAMLPDQDLQALLSLPSTLDTCKAANGKSVAKPNS